MHNVDQHHDAKDEADGYSTMGICTSSNPFTHASDVSALPPLSGGRRFAMPSTVQQAETGPSTAHPRPSVGRGALSFRRAPATSRNLESTLRGRVVGQTRSTRLFLTCSCFLPLIPQILSNAPSQLMPPTHLHFHTHHFAPSTLYSKIPSTTTYYQSQLPFINLIPPWPQVSVFSGKGPGQVAVAG